MKFTLHDFLTMNLSAKITIGSNTVAAKDSKNMGSENQYCSTKEIVVDSENKIVTVKIWKVIVGCIEPVCFNFLTNV